MVGLTAEAAPHNANAGGSGVTTIQVRFGSALRAHRSRLRLTQEQLAERSGLSQKFIGEIERGVANPTIETVSQLASALAIDPGDLLGTPGAASEDHYRISKRDLQMVREAADSLGSVMQRFAPSPAGRYSPRKRSR
jgi:transcriptional regulator with XRE-family HTH domain